MLAPGSLGWMLRHELRLSWRYMAGRGGGKGGMIVGLVLLVLFALGVGAPLGYASRFIDLDPLPNMAVLIIDAGIAFITVTMLAQTLAMATLVFHDRGDLDLLLASPVKPARILAVRNAAMAFNAMTTFLFLLTPLILTSAVLGGHWGLLSIFPLVVCLGLLATAIGVSLAMALFRVLGPRRTRTVAQVLGALIGVSVFLATQIRNMAGPEASRALFADMILWLDTNPAAPLLEWPARAATGDLVPLLAIIAGSLSIFAVVTVSLGAGFADNAALAAGEAAPVRKARARAASAGFKTGVARVMIGKELKLLWRDPALISQVLLQVFYLLPVTFIILRNSTFQTGAGAIAAAGGASVVVFLAGQIAAGLGWLTISAEEAPEMLTCAPVTPHAVARAKVAAVVIPVAVLIAIPSLGLAWISPWAAVCALIVGAAGAAAIGYVELWLQRPGKRSDFRMRRKGTGSIWVALLELLLNSLFGGIAFLAAMKSPFALAPALVAVAVLAVIKKDRWLNRDD